MKCTIKRLYQKKDPMSFSDLPPPSHLYPSHFEISVTNLYQGESYPAEVGINGCGQCYNATRDITPGTVVERFVGPKVKYEDVPEEEIIYVACNGSDLWIIPETNARYINHSCDPNCTINDRAEVVAIRPIKAGEEITFDYVTLSEEEWGNGSGFHFWDPRWTFECQCGAEHCYGLIDRYFVKKDL